MTELRDARLRQAMDAAPDAALRPPQRTRDAVRAAAHAAVGPRRWRFAAWAWPGAGPRAWPAAFATVLLAGFITVLWRGQEIPGTQPEPPAAERAAPTAAVPASPAAPAPEAAPPPPQPAPSRAPVRARPAAPPPAAAQATPAPPEPPPVAAAAPVDVAPAAPPAPLADAGPQSQRAADEMRSREASALQRRAPAPALQAEGAVAMQPWTQVRIEAGSRSVVVPRAQAGALAALLQRVLRADSQAAVPQARAELRLELASGDEPVGVLQWGGGVWRWQPLAEPGPERALRLDAGLEAALREEAERLLQQ
jgi:Meckel syndrome type 1 protein